MPGVRGSWTSNGIQFVVTDSARNVLEAPYASTRPEDSDLTCVGDLFSDDSLAPFSPLGLGSQEALAYRKRLHGMIRVASKVPLKDSSVLSLIYTPGVAAPCLEIAREPLTSFDYTIRGNTIALLSDGSAAFGLGNIGPMAALPMLEDACILFKAFGGVDAFPVCVDTQDVEQIITIGMEIRPTFGGLCLSSIASPRCFTVADHLARAVNIPVLHAEQDATAAAMWVLLSLETRIVQWKGSPVQRKGRGVQWKDSPGAVESWSSQK